MLKVQNGQKKRKEPPAGTWLLHGPGSGENLNDLQAFFKRKQLYSTGHILRGTSTHHTDHFSMNPHCDSRCEQIVDKKHPFHPVQQQNVSLRQNFRRKIFQIVKNDFFCGWNWNWKRKLAEADGFFLGWVFWTFGVTKKSFRLWKVSTLNWKNCVMFCAESRAERSLATVPWSSPRSLLSDPHSTVWRFFCGFIRKVAGRCAKCLLVE